MVTVSYRGYFDDVGSHVTDDTSAGLGAYDALMSESPEVNGTAPAPPAPAMAEPEEVTTGEKLMSVLAIMLGAAVIIMGLDMLTGGRVLGFAIPPAEGQ